MTRVYFFSGSGHSRAVAEYAAGLLGVRAERITGEKSPGDARCAVVVFPVYCQNVPAPVKAFLPSVRAEFSAVIATYGGISPGNVLADCAGLLRCPLTAAACVPTGHSLLGEGVNIDKDAIGKVAQKVCSPSPVSVPKMKKSLFADFFPALRSRIGTKIEKSPSCDGCGICVSVCPVGGERRRCIRCLRCVRECPKDALQVRNSRALIRYLDRERETKPILFT